MFLLRYLYDPVTKSRLSVTNRMDGGGYVHLNKYHPLYNEIINNPEDRFFEIPFFSKVKGKRILVRAYSSGFVIQQGDDLKINGIYFKEYSDNLKAIKMIGKRRRLYGQRTR